MDFKNFIKKIIIFLYFAAYLPELEFWFSSIAYLKNRLSSKKERDSKIFEDINRNNSLSSIIEDSLQISNKSEVFIIIFFLIIIIKENKFQEMENIRKSLLISSIEPMASTLALTLFMLAVHPKLQEQLLAELKKV